MKNSLLLTAMLVLASGALCQAQEQKSFKEQADEFKMQADKSKEYIAKHFHVGVGGGIVHSSFPSRGLLADVELAYRFNAPWMVGLRADVYVGTVFGPNSDRRPDVTYLPTLRNSFSINIRYFLRTGEFKPYVGAGIGMYGLSPAHYRERGDKTGMFVGGTEVTRGGYKSGVYPHIGMQYGLVDLSVDYHIIPRSSIIQSGRTGHVDNNLLCLRLNFVIGSRTEPAQ